MRGRRDVRILISFFSEDRKAIVSYKKWCGRHTVSLQISSK